MQLFIKALQDNMEFKDIPLSNTSPRAPKEVQKNMMEVEPQMTLLRGLANERKQICLHQNVESPLCPPYAFGDNLLQAAERAAADSPGGSACIIQHDFAV